MTTATDTLRGALDDHDRYLRDKSVGDHAASISVTGSLPEDDDLQLIARVAAKDQQAFTILYQRYASRLGRFLSKFLKNHALVYIRTPTTQGDPGPLANTPMCMSASCFGVRIEQSNNVAKNENGSSNQGSTILVLRPIRSDEIASDITK